MARFQDPPLWIRQDGGFSCYYQRMIKDVVPFRYVWSSMRGQSRSTRAIIEFVAFMEKKLGAEFVYDYSHIERKHLKKPPLPNLPEEKLIPRDAYGDLKDAVRKFSLKHRRDGIAIIQSEETGAWGSWIFDFRALLLQPYWLNRYAEIFWERYAPHYPFQVGGIETASIALMAAIVMKGAERGTPVNGFFIRKSRKRKGLMKTIEGILTNDPIILVDDLMNSGQTLHKQIEVLSSAGKTVKGIFLLLIFRDRGAYTFLHTRDISLDALFTLTDFGIPMVTSSAPHIPKESFEVLWRTDLPNPSLHIVLQKSAPAVDEHRLYIGGDSGVFHALSQETGKILWTFEIGRHPRGKGILSSPALHKGVVYFGAYDGTVYALDAKTGKIVWSYADADWVGSSPSIAPDLDLTFVGLEFSTPHRQGGIVALSLDDGTPVWEHHTEMFTHGSPRYIQEERMVVTGSNDGTLYAYDAKMGTVLWQYETGGAIKASCAYDEKRRLILFGSMDGACYALSAEDGSLVFSHQTEAGIYSTPLVRADTTYVASLDKQLYAIDLATGDVRWSFETAGRLFASPAYIEDAVWIGSNDGRLYEVNPETGALKSFFQTPERIVNRIAYNPNTKRFFVPTCTNQVYGIQRR